MHTQSAHKGFTLIELLIVIAIIGILSAVLVPNLLSARSRAFDVKTQNCLKAVSTQQHATAADYPFEYDPDLDPQTNEFTTTLCSDVNFTVDNVTATEFEYQAKHPQGRSTYRVSLGTSVVLFSTP